MSKQVYFQLHNTTQDPVYMDMSTGKLYWVLPSESCLPLVKYLSYFAETGQQYYENLYTGEVSWFLPSDQLSASALSLAENIQKNDRVYSERMIGSKYREDLSVDQVVAIDNYLANKEEQQAQPQPAQTQGKSTNTGTTAATTNSFLAGGFDDDDEDEDNNDDDDEDDDNDSVKSALTMSSTGTARSTTSMKSVAMVKKTVLKVSLSPTTLTSHSLQSPSPLLSLDIYKSLPQYLVAIGRSASLQSIPM